MKRSLAGLMCAVLLLTAVLVGCSDKGEDPNFTVDITVAAERLHDELKWDDKLSALTAEIAAIEYGIAEGTTVACYRGSGATAEQIAVFECADAAAADSLVTSLEKYIAGEIESYKGYVPAEVPRLEDAIIKKQGKCVVLCVTGDTKTAESVISSLFSK